MVFNRERAFLSFSSPIYFFFWLFFLLSQECFYYSVFLCGARNGSASVEKWAVEFSSSADSRPTKLVCQLTASSHLLDDLPGKILNEPIINPLTVQIISPSFPFPFFFGFFKNYYWIQQAQNRAAAAAAAAVSGSTTSSATSAKRTSCSCDGRILSTNSFTINKERGNTVSLSLPPSILNKYTKIWNCLSPFWLFYLIV